MFDFTVSGISLLALVFGLVEFIKGLGKLTLISAGLGLVIGVSVKLQELFPILTTYFEIGFYGMAWGLAASGFYKFLDDRFPEWGKHGAKDDRPGAA